MKITKPRVPKGLIAGLAVLAVAAASISILEFSTNRAGAQAMPGPQKWEYKFLERFPGMQSFVGQNTGSDYTEVKKFKAVLEPAWNGLGAEGWEMCATLSAYGYIFKRPLKTSGQ
jgi:hypothetical protein